MEHFSKFMHSSRWVKVCIRRIGKICLPECKMSPNGEPTMPRSVRTMKSNFNSKYAS